MLGFLDDAWQRFVGNIGVTGPDKGQGGKYLVLPPGYDGKVPEGYFLLKPRTNKNFLFLRGSIKDGLKPAVENITSKLQRLSAEGRSQPAADQFVNMSGKAFNTVFPNDLGYLRELEQDHSGGADRCDRPGSRAAPSLRSASSRASRSSPMTG